MVEHLIYNHCSQKTAQYQDFHQLCLNQVPALEAVRSWGCFPAVATPPRLGCSLNLFPVPACAAEPLWQRLKHLPSTRVPNFKPKTTMPTDTVKTPRSLLSSNPSSPRSPLKLSIFRNSFKLRNSYGICLQSVKTGQGTTIYTAEYSHAFHFSCIAAHVRKQGSLVCLVCNTTWKDEPLLMIHKNRKPEEDEVSHREHEEMAQAAVSNGKREDDMTMGPTKQCSLG